MTAPLRRVHLITWICLLSFLAALTVLSLRARPEALPLNPTTWEPQR